MLRRRNLFQERYAKFENELRNEILTGSIPPGEFILPENTLSQKYGLSRVSVRKVLAALVEEGLIEKIAGKGNRVKPPSDQVERTVIHLYWFSGSYEIPIIEHLIRQYESLHPFIRVELTLLPQSEYTSSLVQMIDKGFPVDLFVVSDFHFRQFHQLNRTDLLDPYLPESLDPGRDSYPILFDMFKDGGEQKVVPLFFSPVVLAYNQRMFEEAGLDPRQAVESWDSFLETAKRCTQDLNYDGKTDRFGFCFSTSANRWPIFMLQNGGSIMKPDRSRSVFSSPATVEALKFCVDLMYKHHVSPVYLHGSRNSAEHLFLMDRVAMVLTTYYYMNEFRQSDFTWNVLPVPAGGRKVSLLLGSGVGINRHSANPTLVRRFVDFLASKEAQTTAKQMGCTIPMLRSVAEDDQWLTDGIHPRNYNVFREVLPYSVPMSSLNLSQQEMDAIWQDLNLLWANMESPEQATKRIEQWLNDQLEKKTT
ncbi:extracellular solute-binding protein [Paenibacillus residui]|uniref:Extracellular solute-binding protein n=1 Tax=Paenibacillus residui TaxID=629724 RepID=A0ABW3D401_9BACL